MARRVKTGRKASIEDRARAAMLVKHYFLALASPDKRYCINPEDGPEFHTFIDGTDVEPLLDALQRFADHGTFAQMDTSEPFFMRLAMRNLRNDGMTYEDAIAKLAEEHNASASTITRMVRRTVKS